MRVNTGGTSTFDFGLSGRETQDSIDEEKYIALAYSNPRGLALAELVEQHWHEWVAKVEAAPWLRNWVRSPLRGQVATTPRGTICDKVAGDPDLAPWSSIALAIYTNTIWGIGLDRWLRGPAQALESVSKTRLAKSECGSVDPKYSAGSAGRTNSTRVNEPMICILQLQNVRKPNQARTYMWDDVLYRGCGLHVPVEVGELDRWLEPLWLKVLELEEEARKLAYRNSLK